MNQAIYTVYKNININFCFFLLFTFSQAVCSEAHDVPLEDLNGNHHSLDKYVGKGKWVIVNIWATACPYCRDELFDLTDFHDRHNKQAAMVIGLTLDYPSFGYPDKDELVNYAMEYFIDYPLLMVDQKLASKVIGKPVDMIPLTFFYNPEGKLVHRINGVVTEKMLEQVIANPDTSYSLQWAEQVPPEYRPE